MDFIVPVVLQAGRVFDESNVAMDITNV